jgi:large subunit ribosomal protein L15
MRLNELKDKPGARQARKRVGRGMGSGRGKTATRGHKGQKSRSGAAIGGYEGGQMPIHMRLPKRGFKNIFSKHYAVVNLGRVQTAIDDKRLDAKKPITIEALQLAGLVGKVRDGVRLLAKGELKSKASFEITGASAAAVAAVEKLGGDIKLGAGAKAEPKKAVDAKPEAEKSSAKPVKAKKPAKKASDPVPDEAVAPETPVDEAPQAKTDEAPKSEGENGD